MKKSESFTLLRLALVRVSLGFVMLAYGALVHAEDRASVRALYLEKQAALLLSPCPAFIGNPKSKQYISTAGLICSGAKLSKGGMKLGQTIVTGQHDFVKDFDWTGQGGSNSPAFQVGKTPALITYNYNDSNNRGSFKITLVDVVTHKNIETLVNAHGAVSSSTLVQHQGGFYLHIEGSTDVKGEDDTPADWDVQLSFGDE